MVIAFLYFPDLTHNSGIKYLRKKRNLQYLIFQTVSYHQNHSIHLITIFCAYFSWYYMYLYCVANFRVPLFSTVPLTLKMVSYWYLVQISDWYYAELPPFQFNLSVLIIVTQFDSFFFIFHSLPKTNLKKISIDHRSILSALLYMTYTGTNNTLL